VEFKIPEALQKEHDGLHEELARLIKLPGKVGEAARKVATHLHDHFLKEEQYALPPLGLLRDLARGPVTPEMAGVTAMTDRLRADQQTMLAEHMQVVVALHKLIEVGRKEMRPAAVHFAEALKLHAEIEEQVLYPAALLVGEYVKARLGK
jgi:hypothetical protein